MGIRVECPNGHVFKVKDKYAGKKGLCPHCKDQVQVIVPEPTAAVDLDEILQIESIQRRHPGQSHGEAGSSSVLEEPQDLSATGPSSASGSLLGSSVIRHNIRCRCGEHVPMWYARCPACGGYLEH
jgi:hypothetical protein